MRFDEPRPADHCHCSRRSCPRLYLALTGFVLGGFLVLHLGTNALGLWPGRFQAAVNRNRGLGGVLPALEIGLVLLPLAIHAALGVRTLRRERLTFGVAKHHHGSDLRQWLQRVTASILLVFIAFHLVTLHRWFGGRFDPENAFSSVSQSIRHYWLGLPVAHPANQLMVEFYLLAVAAAVYHLANGIATGAEVLGLATTPDAQRRLWHACLIGAPALGLAGLGALFAFALR
jgi:succinate dehydrogenase / fumarate reductase cytochrome b subunit